MGGFTTGLWRPGNQNQPRRPGAAPLDQLRGAGDKLRKLGATPKLKKFPNMQRRPGVGGPARPPRPGFQGGRPGANRPIPGPRDKFGRMPTQNQRPGVVPPFVPNPRQQTPMGTPMDPADAFDEQARLASGDVGGGMVKGNQPIPGFRPGTPFRPGALRPLEADPALGSSGFQRLPPEREELLRQQLLKNQLGGGFASAYSGFGG